MAEEKMTTEEIEEKPINRDGADNYREKSFKEKCWHVKNNITVEPLLAGLIIPSIIARFAMTNLNLDKACRVNLKFEDEICDALINRSQNTSQYEKEVQKLISSIDIWKGIINTALPCIMIMFLGSWSDRTGKRKIVILLPIIGELLTSLNNIVNVYFFYEIPVHMTVFLETLFPSITGGWVTMFLGVFSYISDITTEEERTFRVGLVNFCTTAGLPIGVALSGILLQNMGYYGVFTFTTVLFTCVLVYGIFCLPEPEVWRREKGLPLIPRENAGKKVTFFDASHVVDTIKVAFRPRVSHNRVKMLLTLLTVFILFGPSMSEHHVMYLFVRNRLNWDMVKYGLFVSYSILLHSVGAMFTITVLSRKLQIDDALICLISVSSKFVGSIWTAFVQTDIEMYLVPVVELLGGTTFTPLRSIITKLVDHQEMAKVNSLFSLTETLASLVFNPFYSWMYMRTLQVLEGAVFLTSAAFIVPSFFILTVFYIEHRREVKNARRNALENEENNEADFKKAGPLEPNFVPKQIDKDMIKTKL